MSEIVSYFFVGLAVLSVIYILWTSNILYAAFSLVLTFLSIAALYIMAGADFIGATQIMIYVGGIIVIIIFGVMLTNKLSDKPPVTSSHNKVMAMVICGGVFSMLLYAILKMNVGLLGAQNQEIRDLGQALMSEYILPFELAAVLLLLALIGASIIAARKEVGES